MYTPPQNKGRLTHKDIEASLTELVREMALARNSIEEKRLDAARKEETYRRAKSAAFLTANVGLRDNFAFVKDGTVQDKGAYVDETCKEERLEAKIAEAMAIALSEKLKALSAELTAYQSLLKERQSDRQFTNTQADVGPQVHAIPIVRTLKPISSSNGTSPAPLSGVGKNDNFLATGKVNQKFPGEPTEDYPTNRHMSPVLAALTAVPEIPDPFDEDDDGEIGDDDAY